MIVISGALAVVAFVLLIAGLVQSGLGLVYASIVVSLVSAVFLGVGAYQRRGEDVGIPAAGAGPEPITDEEVTRVVPVAPVAPIDAPTPAFAGIGSDGASDQASDRASAGVDTVLVVPGRPRYHVTGCRYLVGKDGEERSLGEARNEGYTACGICHPDENLGAGGLEPAFVGGSYDDDQDEEPTRTPARSTRTAKKSPAKRSTTRSTTAKKTTAKKTPAKKSTSAKRTATSSTARKSSSSTAKTPAKKSTSTTKKTAAKKSTTRASTSSKTTAKRSAKKPAKKTTRR